MYSKLNSKLRYHLDKMYIVTVCNKLDNVVRQSLFNPLFYRYLWHRPHHFRTSANTARERRTYTTKMNSHRQALLLSSSNCHGYSMLEFAKEEICSFLNNKNIKELLFIPFAQNDFNKYTSNVSNVIEPWGFKVTGIHTHSNPVDAISSAQAVFVGGGNTFLLLKRLYENNLVGLIKKRVFEGNLLYMGSSAGTNVATKSINTTNDMPIAFPPTFDAIGIVPFNINPHYIDLIESETHKGETRDQRIGEYMEMDYAAPVLGLREGSILSVNGNCLTIKGVAGAVLFQKGQKKTEYPVGSDISFLLE